MSARRCHGVWAPDAPEWLARLAAADEPAEMARFVVERIEALQHLRLLIARSLFGAVEGLDADGAGERERIVLLHTLEHERGDWIRWAGAGDRLHDLAEGLGAGSRRAPPRALSPCSRSRAGMTTSRSGRPSGPRADTRPRGVERASRARSDE